MDLSIFSQHTQFALKLMDEVSAFIASNFDGDYKKELKKDKTVVTEIDKKAEEMIRSAIKKAYPDNGILGEEFGEDQLDADFIWIIDPIDGTKNFSNDVPLYGSILALHYKGKAVLGVIDHPSLGRRIWAEKGKGCYYLDHSTKRGIQKIQTGDCSEEELTEELIAVTSRKKFIETKQTEQYEELFRKYPNVKTFTDCFGHTLAVKGAFGAMMDYGINLWDICATQIITEEAGGLYYEEKYEKNGMDYYNIICGKPKVVKALIKHFQVS